MPRESGGGFKIILWLLGPQEKSYGNAAEVTGELFLFFFNIPNHKAWSWEKAIIVRTVAIFWLATKHPGKNTNEI